MRLYTRTGDTGETGLIGGKRVPKDDLRVDTYGQVDELNSTIGLAASACEDAAWRERMQLIQRSLFDVGAHLADPNADESTSRLRPDEIRTLEGWIDEADAAVPTLTNFVLPGGSESASRLHAARAVARRAERAVVTLARRETVSPKIVEYLNRLGDLLFAWARLANVRANVPDVIWTTQPKD